MEQLVSQAAIIREMDVDALLEYLVENHKSMTKKNYILCQRCFHDLTNKQFSFVTDNIIKIHE